MFRALDTTTDRDVLTLDIDHRCPPVNHRVEGDTRPYDPLEVQFRAKCKQGTLVCPSCKEPLRFRRGRLRTAHFAHRATSACRHAKNDKPQHLAARAALYRLLRRKLEADNSPLAAGQLVIEQPSDSPEQTRQIDVRLVPGGGGDSFDYLLVDRLFNYNERNAWSAHGRGPRNLHRLGIGRRFTLNHHGPVEPNDPLPESGTSLKTRLAPQELELAHSSPYAAAWAIDPDSEAMMLENGWPSPPARTADFLIPLTEPAEPEPEAWELVSLRFTRDSNSACIVRTPLDRVLIGSHSGELIHPGDPERVRAWHENIEAERQRLKAERIEWEAQQLRQKEEDRRRTEIYRRNRAAHGPSAAQPPQASASRTPRPAKNPAIFEPPPDPEITCVLCGQVARDWWYHDPKTGTGKCNDCLRNKNK